MEQTIQKRAKDGINFPRDPKYKVKIDSASQTTLGGMMGETILEDERSEITPDTPHISIVHTDIDGSKHEIKMECHLTGKLRQKFRSHCQKYSKVFFKNPNNVPYLRDEDGPIKASLGIRTDAVLKYHKPIPLSAEHKKAVQDHIDAKLKNKTLVRIPRQSWASQVLIVPKNRQNPDGSTSYRFVQSFSSTLTVNVFHGNDIDQINNLTSEICRTYNVGI